MSSQGLEDYILNELQKNSNEEDIKASLRQVGWNEEAVTRAFEKARLKLNLSSKEEAATSFNILTQQSRLASLPFLVNLAVLSFFVTLGLRFRELQFTFYTAIGSEPPSLLSYILIIVNLGLVFLIAAVPSVALYSIATRKRHSLLVYLVALAILDFSFNYLGETGIGELIFHPFLGGVGVKMIERWPHLLILLPLIAVFLVSKTRFRVSHLLVAKGVQGIHIAIAVFSLLFLFYPKPIDKLRTEISSPTDHLPYGTIYFRTSSGEIKRMDQDGEIEDMPCTEFNTALVTRTQDKFYCDNSSEDSNMAKERYLFDLVEQKSIVLESIPEGFSPISWSKDGRYLLFVGKIWDQERSELKNTGLLRLDTETLEVRKIYPIDDTKEERVEIASFSPDDQRITLVTVKRHLNDNGVNVGAMAIKIINNDGGEERILLEGLTDQTPDDGLEDLNSLHWLSDGRKIMWAIRFSNEDESGESHVRYEFVLKDLVTNDEKKYNFESELSSGLDNGYFFDGDRSLFYLETLSYIKGVGFTDKPNRYGDPNINVTEYEVNIYKINFDKGNRELVKKIKPGPRTLVSFLGMTQDARWLFYGVASQGSNYWQTFLEETQGKRKIKLFNESESVTLNKGILTRGIGILTPAPPIYWFY